MIITLTTKTSYDLNNTEKFKNFRDNVNRMIKNGNRDSEITHILKQLDAAVTLEKKVGDLKQKIKEYLSQKENKPNQAIPLNVIPVKVEKSRQPQWKKTGEHDFQSMYVRLIEDAKQFHGTLDFMVAYSAHVISMFMHMATVTPHQTHAVSQEREFNSGYCLQYGRSQGKHPNAKLFRKMGEFSVQNRLPFNSVFFKMLKDIDPQGFSVIRQFAPETGEVEPDKKPDSYANLVIGHAGLRRNNLDVLMKGLELAGGNSDNSSKAIFDKLTKVICPTKKTFKRDVNIPITIQAFRKSFEGLSSPSRVVGIGSKIMTYRFLRVKNLEEKIEALGLKKISTRKTQKNTTCLFLRLYPEFTTSSAAVKEGVTNTLIAVFSGILQLKLEQKNICLRAERRQSFGFIRPTLTDAGVLTMRLSLGLEPGIFDDVVLESLKELEQVLTTLDFQNQTHPVVKKVLEIKKNDPNKKGQYSFIQSAVSSDKRTLLTFNQAQIYIKKFSVGNTLEKAVEIFLSDFILDEKKLPENENQMKVSAVDTQPKEVIELLQNVILYAKNMALTLQFDNETPDFQHSFLHAYKKLFKNVSEAIELLNNLDNHKGDEVFHQATRYLENIIEYSLVLNAFNHPNLVRKNSDYDPVRILKNTELRYCSRQLGIPLTRLHLFFTDSGQQAINLPLLVYGHMYKQDSNDKACIHLFGDTYFEISAFFDDIKRDNVPVTTINTDKVRVLVVDVTQLESLKPENFPNLATCIIDLTHYPDVNNPVLKDKVNALLRKSITVVLSSSLLKHEQLGQDKLQSGRFFVISPETIGITTSKATIDEFQGVSDEAMNPYMASAFNMFNDICDVKPKVGVSFVRQVGLFARKKVEERNGDHTIEEQILVKP